ncbi:hypothetical protein L596_027649 [Steinernema carpocapsae]|uniref:Uncharacterized protein n=1 Tax=Steinernema carpocapsae TaxID=34508 RepID=A0A4V5ZXM8_STECR|nr:hypothetical protein L596_027649 [Steinernema carpocapsae]
MVERLISKAPCDGSHLLHMTGPRTSIPAFPTGRPVVAQVKMKCVSHILRRAPACSNIGAAVDRLTSCFTVNEKRTNHLD